MEPQRNVRALLELSGCHDIQIESAMNDVIQSAPDPETAVQYLLKLMPHRDHLLTHKWRKHITQLWFLAHPKVPKTAYLPIASKDVAHADVLMELYGLMQELAEHPAALHDNIHEHMLHGEEEKRLAHDIAIFGQDSMHVRRVCDIAEELRLIRRYKGHVRVIESRYSVFQSLPLPTQYYLIWHVDMYHLDWRDYFPQWEPHVVVFQQYLPMVWEILSHMQVAHGQSVDELTWKIVRAFRPMWQQELETGDALPLKPPLGLYEQSMLQGMVEKWLVHGVLKRYGIIEQQESGAIQWTQKGKLVLELERTTKLPCSTDVLQ